MSTCALIIDDERDIRELIALTLNRMGLDCHTAANLEEARHLLASYHFDVCLTDMRLPDGNGVEFVRYIQSTQPTLPVAVITAHGNMQAAVDAMKNGAYDFVSKPVDLHLLRKLVVQAVAINSGRTESANDASVTAAPVAANDGDAYATDDCTDADIDTDIDTDATLPSLEALSRRSVQPRISIRPIAADRLVGQSAAMKNVRLMIAKLARTNAPVWITGESGTGKELIARLIHENSSRAARAFVAINCGAIPAELMESELFGHKKGSFTGANTDKEGLFQRAEGGTLFLDEVAELPLHMQVKLLRAIQERSVRPVGGNEELPVDVRILSASHKNLAEEVEAGRFRHDLYYRLNVICLRSPSLRERPEDIPALVDAILRRHRDNADSAPVQLEDDAINALTCYGFPGNVRELENLLERAIALSEDGVLHRDDLQLPSQEALADNPTRHAAGGTTLRNAGTNEKARLIQALNESRWNRKVAAEKLGLTYRQLRYRIQQLGISSDDD